VYDPGGELREIVQESAGVLEREMDMPDAGSVLQRVMYNPGRIEGGEKANIVAQTCTLELDIRVPWGCDIAGLVRDLEGHAPRAKARLLSMSEPSFTSPQSRVVRRTLEAIAAECGAAPTPVVQWAASDARYLRQAGFDVIEYGPGDITLLHAVDERVPVRDLERASRVYRRVMERYAGDDGE
jgi:succinyl-diaminopimelate desuccinylase